MGDVSSVKLRAEWGAAVYTRVESRFWQDEKMRKIFPRIDFRHKNKQELRKRIYQRDNFTCKRCGWRPSVMPENYDGKYSIYDKDLSNGLCLDHIKPLVRGGTHKESNLQTLCLRCNSIKVKEDKAEERL